MHPYYQLYCAIHLEMDEESYELFQFLCTQKNNDKIYFQSI